MTPFTTDDSATRAIIEAQIDAFLRDDGASAFSFASPRLQQKFLNPQNFMEMVRSGYSAVYRPREVEFQGAFWEGETLRQDVLFVGPDNSVVLAHYYFEQQGDGSWRISAVIMEPLPDLST